MSFYQSIAPWYDAIFPVAPAATARLRSLAGPAPAVILDIACGTGGYAGVLAADGHRVTACDLDPEMISHAEQRPGVRAVIADMTRLDSDLPQDTPLSDLVYCIGNSLVHLPSEAAVAAALRQMAKQLKPGGRCLLQVINYDRVLRQNLTGLPTIHRETPRLEFQRHYRLRADGRLDFITRLSVGADDQPQVLQQSVQLLPLRPDDLLRLLRSAGFESLQTSGSFAGEVFNPLTSQPLIISAIRTD